MDLIVRDLKLADFDSIVKMLSNTDNVIGLNRVDPVLGELSTIGQKVTRSFGFERFVEIYKQILNENAMAAVAEKDGEVIAFSYIIGGKWPGSPYIGELRSPMIAKQYMDQGIGGKIIEYLQNKSKGKFKILSMVLSAADSVELSKLESTYAQKLGFTKWGLAPKFYKRNDVYMPLIFMYCEI
jgi:L-amino acid N-acyltransferase YncA